jgi:hypothetical protein
VLQFEPLTAIFCNNKFDFIFLRKLKGKKKQTKRLFTEKKIIIASFLRKSRTPFEGGT